MLRLRAYYSLIGCIISHVLLFVKKKQKKSFYHKKTSRGFDTARGVVLINEYDIQSVTKIGIEGCRDIFEGDKAQKFISDRVMNMIEKELKSSHFKR